MKIIFLDVDGPLIPGRMHWKGPPKFETGEWRYDPIAVEMLNEMTMKHHARIVFNSSHNDFGLSYMMAQALRNGLGNIHHTVMTGYPGVTYFRHQAVEDWLRAHGDDVTRWCVVDDFIVPTPSYVQVDFVSGLSRANVYQIEGFLNG